MTIVLTDINRTIMYYYTVTAKAIALRYSKIIKNKTNQNKQKGKIKLTKRK